MNAPLITLFHDTVSAYKTQETVKISKNEKKWGALGKVGENGCNWVKMHQIEQLTVLIPNNNNAPPPSTTKYGSLV